MKTLFYDVVNSLFTALEVESTIQSGDATAKVHIEGYTFYIGLLEKSHAIVLQGVVGVLPPEKEKACVYLLRMNNLFSETSGDTLGLDEDSITLQRRVDIQGLDAEKFVETALRFMENLLHMLNLFSQFYALLDADESADSFEQSAVQHTTMIRI